MATIERIRGGYRVRWREGGRGSPKLTDGVVYERKDQAAAAKERIESAVAAAKPLRARAQLPLAEVVTRWALSRAGEGNDVSHTAESAVRVSSLIDAQGWKTTLDITPAAISAWKQAGGSPRAGALLAGVLRYATDFLEQPVAPRALVALRPRYAKKPPGPLVSEQQVRTWFQAALAISPSCGALVHCLGTYGWRAITAAKLQVQHVDLARGAHGYVSLAVKGRKHLDHPITAATRALLAPLVKGRLPSDPLFVRATTGAAWPLRSSKCIPQWFTERLGGKSYDLKRYAITTMLDRMTAHDATLFTGQTVAVLLTYARSNAQRQEAAIELFDGAPWGTEHSPALSGAHIR